MVAIRKLYHDPTGYTKIVWAKVYWTPSFMELLLRKFGFYREFTMEEAGEFFSQWYHLSENATRHKILRLHKKKWVKRESKAVYIGRIKRKIYFYSFSEKAKKYYMYWGGFGHGPLTDSRKPEVVEKQVEVRREIITKDRYLGEI